MPNKNFCQGPTCHEQVTQDRFLKSRGVIRGRYAYADLGSTWYYGSGDKFFCSQRCKFDWLEFNMPNIEQDERAKVMRKYQMIIVIMAQVIELKRLGVRQNSTK